MRMPAAKTDLGYSKIHLEERKGTREEARNYCMKLESRKSGPFELGTWEDGGQGKRTDMDKAALLIQEKGVDAVADAMPGTFIRMQKHFTNYQTYLDNRHQPDSREILCFWMKGPSDIGKTHAAYAVLKNMYTLCPGKGQGWWDGYNKETSLLIDELMVDTVPAADIIHIADKWKYRCPIKGGFTWARWNTLVVTSNSSIEFIYAGIANVLSIMRRFKVLEVRTRADCVAASEYIAECVACKGIPEKTWICPSHENAITEVGRGVVGSTGYDVVPRTVRFDCGMGVFNEFSKE